MSGRVRTARPCKRLGPSELKKGDMAKFKVHNMAAYILATKNFIAKNETIINRMPMKNQKPLVCWDVSHTTSRGARRQNEKPLTLPKLKSVIRACSVPKSVGWSFPAWKRKWSLIVGWREVRGWDASRKDRPKDAGTRRGSCGDSAASSLGVRRHTRGRTAQQSFSRATPEAKSHHARSLRWTGVGAGGVGAGLFHFPPRLNAAPEKQTGYWGGWCSTCHKMWSPTRLSDNLRLFCRWLVPSGGGRDDCGVFRRCRLVWGGGQSSRSQDSVQQCSFFINIF